MCGVQQPSKMIDGFFHAQWHPASLPKGATRRQAPKTSPANKSPICTSCSSDRLCARIVLSNEFQLPPPFFSGPKQRCAQRCPCSLETRLPKVTQSKYGICTYTNQSNNESCPSKNAGAMKACRLLFQKSSERDRLRRAMESIVLGAVHRSTEANIATGQATALYRSSYSRNCSSRLPSCCQHILRVNHGPNHYMLQRYQGFCATNKGRIGFR